MRIGVISKGSPDYLIDIVTDGLIRLLGRDSLSLDYNVRGGWRGQYAILLQGFNGPEPFDIHDADVLIGSIRSIAAIEAWMKATGKSKVAVIDGEDDGGIRSFPERGVSVYFKREYLSCQKYPPIVQPLPFAAIPERLPPPQEISSPVFFRAYNSNVIRPEIEKALKEIGYSVPSGRVEKEEYNQALMSSLVGVSTRGGGWDTYRYWEIAYFGRALLSQDLGITIPDNFENGKEAVFFSDVPDFKVKLREMLSTPERTADMGRRARAKCLKHHLSTNRARTVLEALA